MSLNFYEILNWQKRKTEHVHKTLQKINKYFCKLDCCHELRNYITKILHVMKSQSLFYRGRLQAYNVNLDITAVVQSAQRLLNKDFDQSNQCALLPPALSLSNLTRIQTVSVKILCESGLSCIQSKKGWLCSDINFLRQKIQFPKVLYVFPSNVIFC